ncbi:hypothetical protein [Xanthomonas sacchari]|uniref:hypothetical protein n=1 Tax=Xanthomonas sacchari TaxID=56458 RepID=UPI00225199A3|nr:hypothetical protein [Xanthomonas sacchari]
MNTILLITILVLLTVGASFIIIRRKAASARIEASEPSRVDSPSVGMLGAKTDLGCDFALFDDNGMSVLECREIERIPARTHTLDSSGSGIERVRHLAADLFKGAASVPGRTVEVVFKPEIQKGLTEGTYSLMRTKSREILADAVDSSNKVVGKARLMQGGKAKQLAGGAFQLVSIAVAQSHLADIEKSLGVIKDSIAEVIQKQENEDKARITGAFDYIKEIASHMRELRCPDELPQHKMNTIEGVIKDSYAWRNKLEEDMSSLIRQISTLTDSDTFGTGDTFNKLKGLIERVRPLLARRELFLNLASALDFLTAYLDPAQRNYSRMSVNEEPWNDLLEQFREAVSVREAALLGKAFWNSGETLQLRKDKLRSMTSDYHRLGKDQQASYLHARHALNESMSRLIEPSGNIRIAIAFDDQGGVGSAAIL